MPNRNAGLPERGALLTPACGARRLSLAVQIALAVSAISAAPLQAAEPTSGTSTLETVDVTSSSLSDATEDTQSYTAPAAKTATPLSLSIRETPQSVSVVTQQRMQDQNLQTIMDVVNNTTGVSVNRYETNRAQFNARGFEINSLMIDNVPTIWDQPWSSGEVFSSLVMYDRVEIVRGANGLMTGAGDPSASINMVHKRASSQDLKGSVQAKAGRWDTYGAEADVSMALNQAGTVRGRVVGEYSDGDSWVNMLSETRQTAYGTVDIDLASNTVLWLGASHQQNNNNSPMWGGLPVWYADGSHTDWSRSKTTSADWSYWDSTYDNYFANVEHSFANGWLATLGYSRGEREADSYLLYLFGNPSPAMYTFPGSYHTQTEQDDISATVSGPFSLLGRKHELALGYIYSNQKFDARDRASGPEGFAGIPDFDSYHGEFPEPTWSTFSGFYEESETTQEAAYVVARFSLADPLKLIVGSRVSNYEKTGHDKNTNPLGHKNIDVDNELTPYAGLIYDLTQNLSAYVSYTDIFLPQSEHDINSNSLDPVVGKSAETGVKGEFLDGRLNTSLGVFRIVQDNLAVSTGVPVPNRPWEIAYEESDGATSRGFEIEVSGELSAGWNATAGYTQFKVEDSNGDDINTLYPRKLLRTFTTYRLPGEWNKLTVGGGWNWQTDIYTLATNPLGVTERIEQKSYSLIDLMARYDFTQQLSAQVNATNVQDTTYFDVFDAYGALTYGEPYAVTASVKYSF